MELEDRRSVPGQVLGGWKVLQLHGDCSDRGDVRRELYGIWQLRGGREGGLPAHNCLAQGISVLCSDKSARLLICLPRTQLLY